MKEVTVARLRKVAKAIAVDLASNSASANGKIYFENCNGDLFRLGLFHQVSVKDLRALALTIHKEKQ